MDYIMITFRADNRDIDLKVPVFVRIGELLQILGQSLNLQVSENNLLQAEPLGRILDQNKTLEEEAVTQGSLLTLI